MANETENIESKLAAYVDGELAEADRADIEAYLDANPQHRALIESLRQDRQALRDQPRESAPTDIAEALHGQLERSALLGGAGGVSFGDSSRSRMRIYRLPQITAIAAMLLLAVGLGFVVYLALPPSRPAGFSMAPAKVAPTEDRSEADFAGRKPAAAPVDTKSNDVFARADDVDKTPAYAGKLALKGSDATGSLQKQMAGNAMFQNSGTAQNALSSRSQALTVVVNTDNPVATETQLRTYFATNNISWETAAEPMPEPLKLGTSQVVEAARYNSTQVRLLPKDNEKDFDANLTLSQAPAPAPNAAPALAPATASTPRREFAIAQSSNEPGVTSGTTTGTANGGVALGEDHVSAAAIAPRPVTIPTKGWYDASAVEGKQVAAAASPPAVATETPKTTAPTLAQTGQTWDIQGQLAAPPAQVPSANLNNTYIARGLTRQQATELTNSLSNTRAGQSVELFDDNHAADNSTHYGANLGREFTHLSDQHKSLPSATGGPTTSDTSSVAQEAQRSQQQELPASRATGGYAFAEQLDQSKKEQSEKRLAEGAARERLKTDDLRDLNTQAGAGAAVAGVPGAAAPAVAAPAGTQPTPPATALQPKDNVLITLGDPTVEGNIYRIKVAADGAVSVPPIGSVAASGKSEAELEQAIADQFKTAKLEVPSIRVRNLGEAESEQQPLLVSRKAMEAAPQQLQQQQLAPASTQAAAADEKVDVVFVLRNNDSAQAGAEVSKTTAPAAKIQAPTTKP